MTTGGCNFASFIVKIISESAPTFSVSAEAKTMLSPFKFQFNFAIN